MGKPPKSPEANVSYGKSKKIIMHMRRRSASRPACWRPHPMQVQVQVQVQNEFRGWAGWRHLMAETRCGIVASVVLRRRKAALSPE